MADEIKKIEDVLSDFSDKIDKKNVKDYSKLFSDLSAYMNKKRKRDFRKAPEFLIQLDDTLEDITEYLKKNKSIIKDRDVLTLINKASNLGTSLSTMSDDTMISMDPVFFERVVALKEHIQKISKAMQNIIIIVSVSDIINQSNNLLNLVN